MQQLRLSKKLVKRHATIFHKGGHFRQALTSCHEIHLKTSQLFREAQRNFSEVKNAPCTFQNTIKEILGTFWRKFVIAYLDDLIVYSYTEEEHLNHLALIFELLKIYGLSCNPKKCHFGKTKLEYLDHIVTSDGNHVQLEHIQAILEAKPPQTVSSQYLGLSNGQPWLRNRSTRLKP